ncbi:MAG: toll/interleukin-1 receptor domain-containing protein, partial [Opitutaceae bacterium]
MADVFISYSRKDSAFVKRLDEALTSRGRKTWVDWEGIAPTEEFMQAIYAAIDSADTFVFVLSPDSIASAVCGMEIAHAVASNKRMVPVVAREVSGAAPPPPPPREAGGPAVPEALAKLNWIFCRDTDGFDAAVDTLVGALDTDLDWVRAHTRLTTRATEWEKRGKDSSFVLRGIDLRAAEVWLTQAGADEKRQPTALQTEYIIASRKGAARRQRMTLGAVSFGLVLAIALAIAAWFQRNKALASLSQSDFMEGTRLVKADQAGRALPYFARAVRLTGHPASATRIASLLTQRAWAVPVASQSQPDAAHARYSRDGRNVIAVLLDGSVVLRDGATSRPRAILAPGGRAIEAGISPDGALAVTLIATGDERALAVQFWNADTGAQIGTGTIIPVESVGSAFPEYSPAPEQDPGAILFSADSSRVVVYTQQGRTAAVWDARAGRKFFDLPDDVIGGSFSANGHRVAVSEHDRGVSVWESATGR